MSDIRYIILAILGVLYGCGWIKIIADIREIVEVFGWDWEEISYNAIQDKTFNYAWLVLHGIFLVVVLIGTVSPLF